MAAAANALPDELLAEIFALLAPSERLGAATLVCRRWHAIAHSPVFLDSLEFAVCLWQPKWGDSSAPPLELERLESFAAFLRRHAGPVRCLRIDVGKQQRRDRVDGNHLEYAFLDASEVLSECMGAWAENGGGALRTLRCRFDAGLYSELDCSFTGLSSLTELSIEGVAELEASLAPLAHCGRLELLQTSPTLPSSVQLPLALTHLTYGLAPGRRYSATSDYVKLPALRLYALAGVLQSLELRGCGVGLESGSLPVVSRLTALTALRLNHFSNLPQTLLTALPALHRLQNLQLVRLRESGEFFEEEEEDDGEWVEDPPDPPLAVQLGPTLGQLTGLTSLVVHDVVAGQLFNLPPPPELAALTRLRRLHYAVYAGGECPGGLPPNAWSQPPPEQQQQGGSGGGSGGGSPLSFLAVEERLLHASRAWLEGPGAAGLRELHVKWAIAPDAFQPGGRDFGQPRWAWFWRWAAAHPALHTLTFDVGSSEDVPPTAGWEEARAQLAAARPGLHLGASDFERLLPGPL